MNFLPWIKGQGSLTAWDFCLCCTWSLDSIHFSLCFSVLCSGRSPEPTGRSRKHHNGLLQHQRHTRWRPTALAFHNNPWTKSNCPPLPELSPFVCAICLIKAPSEYDLRDVTQAFPALSSGFKNFFYSSTLISSQTRASYNVSLPVCNFE